LLSRDNLDISDLLKSVAYDIENKNMYLASSAGSYSNFSLPRDKVSSYNAIKVTIGAENFGTLG
jgi:hypothetical protein